jgi:hypothetical protein
MLDDVERKGEDTHIVSWVKKLGGFTIHKPKLFASRILPKYFENIHYKSFIRQINIYGFSRARTEEGVAYHGAYVHPLFVKGNPDLCFQMTRTKIKGTGVRRINRSRHVRGEIQDNSSSSAFSFFGVDTRKHQFLGEETSPVPLVPSNAGAQASSVLAAGTGTSFASVVDPCLSEIESQEDFLDPFVTHEIPSWVPFPNGLDADQQATICSASPSSSFCQVAEFPQSQPREPFPEVDDGALNRLIDSLLETGESPKRYLVTYRTFA